MRRGSASSPGAHAARAHALVSVRLRRRLLGARPARPFDPRDEPRERRAARARLLGARPLRHLPRARRCRRAARFRRARTTSASTLARVRAGEDERLACQARVLGDGVVGDAPASRVRRRLGRARARRVGHAVSHGSVVGAGTRGREASASTCWDAICRRVRRELANVISSTHGRADDRHGRARLHLRRDPAAGRHRRGMAVLELRLRLDARRAGRARRRAAPGAAPRPAAVLPAPLRACCCSPLAAIGTSAAFSWPRGVQELVIAATLFVVVLRFAWIVVALVLAPGQPRLRLVPVASGPRRLARGDRRWRWCLLFAFARFAPDLMERLAGAPHAAGALRFATITLACLLAARRRVRVSSAARSRAPRFPRSFVLALAGGGGLRRLAAEPDVRARSRRSPRR